MSLDVAVQLREEGYLLMNPLEADSLDTSLLHRELATCLSRLVRELGGDNQAGEVQMPTILVAPSFITHSILCSHVMERAQTEVKGINLHLHI